MHPVLTHVPPKCFRSTTATFMPAVDKRAASAGPAWPVPITIASNRTVIVSPMRPRPSLIRPFSRKFDALDDLSLSCEIPDRRAPVSFDSSLSGRKLKSRAQRRLKRDEIFHSMQGNPCTEQTFFRVIVKQIVENQSNNLLPCVASMLRSPWHFGHKHRFLDYLS